MLSPFFDILFKFIFPGTATITQLPGSPSILLPCNTVDACPSSWCEWLPAAPVSCPTLLFKTKSCFSQPLFCQHSVTLLTTPPNTSNIKLHPCGQAFRLLAGCYCAPPSRHVFTLLGLVQGIFVISNKTPHRLQVVTSGGDDPVASQAAGGSGVNWALLIHERNPCGATLPSGFSQRTRS